MTQPPPEPSWQTYSPQPESLVQDSPSPDGPPSLAEPSLHYPVGAAPIPQRPGYSPQDPLVLSAGTSTLRKTGAWTVPAYIQLQGDIGSIVLDFRRATVTSQVIWLNVSGGLGSILLIVPRGWAAQADRLQKGMGSLKNQVGEQPEQGLPVLVLSGSTGMGSFTIRHPNHFDEKRLQRQLRREERQTQRELEAR